MKKWAVISSNGRDEFIIPYKSKDQAVKEAEVAWDYLTRNEKKTHTVIAGLVNLDDDGNQSEVNGQIDGDVYEIAWENGKINGEVTMKEYTILYDQGTETKEITKAEADQILAEVELWYDDFSEYDREKIEESLIESEVEADSWDDAICLAIKIDNTWYYNPS